MSPQAGASGTPGLPIAAFQSRVLGMSFVGFVLRQLYFTPQVMLRVLPIVFLYGFSLVAIVLSTNNIIVIWMLSFMVGTFGTAFLYVSGLRAGLQAMRLTTAPSVDGLMWATTLMLFFYCVVHLILLISVSAVIFAIAVFVVSPELGPWLMLFYAEQSQSGVQSGLPSVTGADGAASLAPPPNIILSIGILNFLMYCVLGTVMAFFGAPMAATAANAVDHSPKNDMIFGFGRYVPQQLASFMLFVALPTAAFSTLSQTVMPELIVGWAADSTADGGAIGAGDVVPWILAGVLFLIYVLFSMCLPWSGMALAYGLVQDELREERKRERVPVIDYDAEREVVRNLRRDRANTAAITKTYDPQASRRRFDTD